MIMPMTEDECLKRMIAPGQIRHGRYRGGILQIHITRACDLACVHCTQGSNFGGKAVMITVEEFAVACKSLEGYWGVVGIFGGNPALHPKFAEICETLCKYFPYAQRGLWCNHPHGHGGIMRKTFNPAVSNLNVHLVQEAYDEFARDWPECRPYLKGHDVDSRHAPPFVAMLDQKHLRMRDGSIRENTEANRLELIAGCDVNQDWSAMLCTVPNVGLRAFFCEIAGAMAMLHAKDSTWPNLGMIPEPGWWRKSMNDFAHQVRHYCHRCGIPLRLKGELATQGHVEQITETHADVCKPKSSEREIELYQIGESTESLDRMTEYIRNARLS